MYKRNSIGLFYFLVGLCFVATIVAGCSKGTKNGEVPCPNGPQVACACAGGQTGTQQCLNGIYTICSCGAAGSGGETTSSSTNAVITGTGGSAASSTGAGGNFASSTGGGGAYATTTRTGTAGRRSTAKTGQTAGAAGRTATKATKITCPDPLTCESNPAMNGYLDAGIDETIKFCAKTDQGIFQMANARPTPPMCKSDANCKAIGLDVSCTSIDLGGLIFSGCILTGCQ
jgi:hypothetical protein